jgi:DNA repair photolyase
VRRFDAPEALETRFYEVRARSVLNRVPDKSRLPFRWTINPFRGCTHACTYCLSGDTPILMGDAATKPLAKVRVGDAIYGTVRQGVYRRFAVTRVLAGWSTVKPAFRVVLEDGTELIASADHRFLTRRGWKHVLGSEQGSARRPHLTLCSKLMGSGSFAAGPKHSPDYRRGYLCGLIRGDGHVGSYSYDRAGRARGDTHRFRLALADMEALRRAHEYLLNIGVSTDEFQFERTVGARRPMTAIRTSAQAHLEQVRSVIAWPLDPDDEWRKGFLAGIFDAERSGGPRGVIHIHNTDPEILRWIEACLRHFRFDIAVEDRREANGLTSLRIRGGVSENLRFFHTADPAIVRKRSIEGRAVKTSARLNVISIEPLAGAMRLYDITTGTGDFIANGVVSHNCFARPTHKYLDFDAGRDFEREIVVKVNAPEVLRAELARPSWTHEHIALGTNTDPYQWVEGRYRLMEGIWEVLRDARGGAGNPCSVLTKSPLLLRDLPLMLQIAQRTSMTACLSIPTLDEKAWRATEPHTANPRARLEAVAELNRAGIPTGVLIAPLMPGINDAPHQVEPLLEMAAAAGATNIGGVALHLRGEVRQVFMDWLRTQRPDLVPRYEELYRRGANVPQAERERLSRMVRGAGTPAAFRPVRPSPRAPASEASLAPLGRQDKLF